MKAPVMESGAEASAAPRPGRALVSAMMLYALSVAFGKGLLLLTLPFLAHGLPPAEFVRLDMAAALVEPVGLVAGLAMADTLFRFAPADAAGRIRLLRRLASLSLALGLPMVALIQLVLVPLFLGMPNMPGELALRLALLSACCGAFIELPLAFWRLGDRPLAFTAFVIGRALAQAGWLVGAIRAGWGVDGILIGNAGMDLLVILGLWWALPRTTGQAAGGRGAGLAALRYAVPVMAGGLAMYALGSMDRWFLAGAVPPIALAQYALAAKLAMALALAIQPFGLWWYPRRLAVLAQPDGPMLTAQLWLAGMALLCLGAVALMALARLFVLGLFPPAYHGVIGYLPWLIGLVLMNELASLSNGPAYARPTGWALLRVNAAGALLALLLYALLIPRMGVAGALMATAAGQALRLGLFWTDRGLGQRVPYRLDLALAMALATLAAMLLLARADWPSLGWLPGLAAVIALLVYVLLGALRPGFCNAMAPRS